MVYGPYMNLIVQWLFFLKWTWCYVLRIKLQNGSNWYANFIMQYQLKTGAWGFGDGQTFSKVSMIFNIFTQLQNAALHPLKGGLFLTPVIYTNTLIKCFLSFMNCCSQSNFLPNFLVKFEPLPSCKRYYIVDTLWYIWPQVSCNKLKHIHMH